MNEQVRQYVELVEKAAHLPENEQKKMLAQLQSPVFEGLKNEAIRESLAVVARTEDSPAGYEAFYELFYGNRPPRHIMREIAEIYKAHTDSMGSLTFAFRGSWKTTSISETFTAYRIGQEPWKSNLIITSNDDSAEQIMRSIAEIKSTAGSWQCSIQYIFFAKGPLDCFSYLVRVSNGQQAFS